MPKRLLRYVLTKLDYFETDALDLDKIDIAWGQAGHLTWQDVGVKIEVYPRTQTPLFPFV